MRIEVGRSQPFSSSLDDAVIPICVRTKLRAKIILSLEHLGVCTLRDLLEYGFKRSTLHKFMKEFIAAGLVYQRHQLFKLTEDGLDLAKYLVHDEGLKNWMTQTFEKDQDERLIRPRISKVDHLSL